MIKSIIKAHHLKNRKISHLKMGQLLDLLTIIIMEGIEITNFIIKKVKIFQILIKKIWL